MVVNGNLLGVMQPYGCPDVLRNLLLVFVVITRYSTMVVSGILFGVMQPYGCRVVLRNLLSLLRNIYGKIQLKGL